MMLGKLPVARRPIYLNKSKARAYCASEGTFFL